ncbi:hypothetical protein F5884DRAFT_798588 [Xylogone sp. PMI_703]|nr:hypothetical protein F5884DRAFT_798588 [Xylogone sp. PMI_703]
MFDGSNATLNFLHTLQAFCRVAHSKMFTRLPWMSSPTYSSLQEEEGDDKSEQITLKKTIPPRTGWSNIVVVLSLVIATLCASSTLLLYQRTKSSSFQKLEAGFPTDYKPVLPEVDIEEVLFTGGPAFDENGDMYIPNPARIKYIGDPNEEIDQAWDELIKGRYFKITEQEAKEAFGEKYNETWYEKAGAYVAGLDMFHTLHCLDQLRRVLYPDYYELLEPAHLGHCVEQIRQYIMCAGDITPIPTKFFPGAGYQYVVSDVTHTCRNFQNIRDWVSKQVPVTY